MSKTSIEIEGLRLSTEGDVVVEVLRHGRWQEVFRESPDYCRDYESGEIISFSVSATAVGAELKRKFPRGKR